MQTFFDWCKAADLISHPWLVLGKGPSFDRLPDLDIGRFKLMSLNHVVQRIHVTASHILDLDVVEACGDAIDKNAKVLVMPWVPHVNNRAGREDLEALSRKSHILAKLREEGRLLYYNHLVSRMRGDSPLIHVKYFSAEAAINLLATCGVRCIRTLGIDGGNSYGRAFSKFAASTLLANRRKSFNRQFEQMARTIMKTGVDLAPLDTPSPVRVYVATTEAQMLAVKVLEYSIRKHASMSVEVYPLHVSGVEIPQPKDEKNWPRTPFSFQRFVIPELAGYQGRAIYLDSDMQVFKDIKSLWTQAFNGAQVLAVREPSTTGRRPQFSVMLLDCDSLRWDIRDIIRRLDEGKLTYESLMYEMSIATVRSELDPSWNCLERYEEHMTSLLHYTDMSTQPWVERPNPLGYLWFRDLFEAIDNGFISEEYVKEHVDKGYVRPSLWYQVDHRVDDPLLLPKAAIKLDTNYTPPYTGIHRHDATAWTNPQAYLKALVRHYAVRSGLTGIIKRLQARYDHT